MSTLDLTSNEMRSLFENQARAKLRSTRTPGESITFSNKEVSRFGYEAAAHLIYLHDKDGHLATVYESLVRAYARKHKDYCAVLGENIIRRLLKKDLFEIKLAQSTNRKLARPFYLCTSASEGRFVLKCVSDLKEASSILSDRKISLSPQEEKKIFDQKQKEIKRAKREAQWKEEKAKMQSETNLWAFLLQAFSEGEIKQKFIEGGRAAIENLPELKNWIELGIFKHELIKRGFQEEKIDRIIERCFPEIQLGKIAIEIEDKDYIIFLLLAEGEIDKENSEIWQKTSFMKYLGPSSHTHSDTTDAVCREIKILLCRRLHIEKCFQMLSKKSALRHEMTKGQRELQFLQSLKLPLCKEDFLEGSFERKLVEKILAIAKRQMVDPRSIIDLRMKKIKAFLSKVELSIRRLRNDLVLERKLVRPHLLTFERWLSRTKQTMGIDDRAEPMDSCQIDENDGKEFIIASDGEVVTGQGGFFIIDFSKCFTTCTKNKKEKLRDLKQSFRSLLQKNPSLLTNLIGERKNGSVLHLAFKDEAHFKDLGDIQLYYDSAAGAQSTCGAKKDIVEKMGAVYSRPRLDMITSSTQPSQERMIRRTSQINGLWERVQWPGRRQRTGEIDRQEAIATLKMFVDMVLSGKLNEISKEDLRSLIEYIDSIFKSDLNRHYENDKVLMRYKAIFDHAVHLIREMELK